MEPCDLDATEMRRLIGQRKLSPSELLDSCLARIAKTNPTLNAIVAMDEPSARAAAKSAEAAMYRSPSKLAPLHGLPIGIKDLNETAGLRTTFGSPLYQDHIPDRDESLVRRLRNDGAIVLAKTNTPEFGAGSNTDNAVYGKTLNPFDTVRTPGGSSGGSAASLAAGRRCSRWRRIARL